MKITYSKPGTAQWIYISKIEDGGFVYNKVALDRPLPVGAEVYVLYSEAPGSVGLRPETIHSWAAESGARSTLPTYENIGKLLASRDCMFVRIKGPRRSLKARRVKASKGVAGPAAAGATCAERRGAVPLVTLSFTAHGDGDPFSIRVTGVTVLAALGVLEAELFSLTSGGTLHCGTTSIDAVIEALEVSGRYERRTLSTPEDDYEISMERGSVGDRTVSEG